MRPVLAHLPQPGASDPLSEPSHLLQIEGKTLPQHEPDPGNYRGCVSAREAVSGLVKFPDGRSIRGTRVRRPRGDVPAPDFAVYLLGRDPFIDGWPYRWVKWRDFSLPDSMDDAISALGEAHTRAQCERVETACGGGMGRTGTVMSLLAVISGVEPDAVAWARENYTRAPSKHADSDSGSRRRRRASACERAGCAQALCVTRTQPPATKPGGGITQSHVLELQEARSVQFGSVAVGRS